MFGKLPEATTGRVHVDGVDPSPRPERHEQHGNVLGAASARRDLGERRLERGLHRVRPVERDAPPRPGVRPIGVRLEHRCRDLDGVAPVRQPDLAQRAAPATTAATDTPLVTAPAAAAVEQEPKQPDDPWRQAGAFPVRHHRPLVRRAVPRASNSTLVSACDIAAPSSAIRRCHSSTMSPSSTAHTTCSHARSLTGRSSTSLSASPSEYASMNSAIARASSSRRKNPRA